ncbi:TetR family transcriptional regulator [Kitasatospora sp. NPDC059463]|uniref:TetR family transcriptional regulator n=1 Tax=unclassified Kitasatospora TaxID=2633591 RepID=UPI00368843FF
MDEPGAVPVAVGMRDRKKARTREVIRAAALDLFEEEGFEQTTIEHICERADVARRTLFRYYAAKEALLFGWGFGEPILDAFAAAPASLGPWEALVHALDATQGRLEEPAEDTERRRGLRRRFLGIRTVHDYAILQIDNLAQRAADITATRLGVDPLRDLRPFALGGALAAMTRRQVLLGDDHALEGSWADAFRDILSTTAQSGRTSGDGTDAASPVLRRVRP